MQRRVGRPGLPYYTLRAEGGSSSAPTADEHHPGRCEAQLDPLDAVPALLPARGVADFGVGPDTGTFRLEHSFVGGEVLRVVQRRAASAAVDGVARAERLHRRRAST